MYGLVEGLSILLSARICVFVLSYRVKWILFCSVLNPFLLLPLDAFFFSFYFFSYIFGWCLSYLHIWFFFRLKFNSINFFWFDIIALLDAVLHFFSYYSACVYGVLHKLITNSSIPSNHKLVLINKMFA